MLHAFLYPNIVDSTFHHPPGVGWSPLSPERKTFCNLFLSPHSDLETSADEKKTRTDIPFAVFRHTRWDTCPGLTQPMGFYFFDVS